MKRIIFLFVTLTLSLFSCSNTTKQNVSKEDDYTVIMSDNSNGYVYLILKKWVVSYTKYDDMLDTGKDSTFYFNVSENCEYSLSKYCFSITGLPFTIKTEYNYGTVGEIMTIKYILNNKEYIYTDNLAFGDNIDIYNDEHRKRISEYLLTNTEPMYIIVTDEDNKEHKIIVPCIPKKKKYYVEKEYGYELLDTVDNNTNNRN